MGGTATETKMPRRHSKQGFLPKSAGSKSDRVHLIFDAVGAAEDFS